MGCASCGTSVDGKPKGCNSNGGCSSGGCNKLNTFDWLAKMDLSDYEDFDIVEVSFKNGSRKQFYQNPAHLRAIIGDSVVVESASGYDVGSISLTGELVRLQMKKKRVSADSIMPKIIRRANERDLEKLDEARSLERDAMVLARAIARSLGLDMKLGDVEFQGDRRKATFYYTADGRVDFRELIRHYAKEFRVKIEMRQIGARQESSRIGGLGSCGRELCCSTWLTNFKSVTTGAARYQNLAINQSKLSGQCGRLKCCLNYELDTYLDALQDFPKHPEKLETQAGTAILIKTDIFKRLMVYTYANPSKRGNFFTLGIDRVKAILQMNTEGEKPIDLADATLALDEEDITIDFEDVTGAVELPLERRNKRRSRNNRTNNEEERNHGDDKERRREARPERGSDREGRRGARPERGSDREGKKGARSERGSDRGKREARPERGSDREGKREARPERGSGREGKREARPERGNDREGKRGARPERSSDREGKKEARPERNSDREGRKESSLEKADGKEGRGYIRSERRFNKEDREATILGRARDKEIKKNTGTARDSDGEARKAARLTRSGDKESPRDNKLERNSDKESKRGIRLEKSSDKEDIKGIRVEKDRDQNRNVDSQEENNATVKKGYSKPKNKDSKAKTDRYPKKTKRYKDNRKHKDGEASK